jgi:hypothetical protein
MFTQTGALKLTLSCKDCRRAVTDSETVAYRLIRGVLYGWCDECFNHRQTCSDPSSRGEDARIPDHVVGP